MHKKFVSPSLVRHIAFLLILAFVVTESAFARPSKTSNSTPTGKFRQFEGNWFVSDNDANALGPLSVALFANESSPEGSEIFEFTDSGTSVITLSPKKKSIRSSDLRGTYTVPDSAQALQNLIGDNGGFNFSFSPATTGTSFFGTFFPAKNFGLPQVSFVAARIGGNPLSAKIVRRINFKGKRKAGKTLTVLNQYINRGKGTVVQGNTGVAFVVVDGDIDSFTILSTRSKGILLDSCETQIAVGQRAVAQCSFEYLGPPRKSTNATLAYAIELADTAAGTTLQLQSANIGGQFDGSGKTVNLKVGGKKKKDDSPSGSGFYTGNWTCAGFGEMTLSHSKNKVTEGSFSSQNAADTWFPPENGTVGSNIVTEATKSATMKLQKNSGAFTQIDVILASDGASFSGNALFFEASGKAAGSSNINCVKQ